MTTWTLACACGGRVTANTDDPLPGVLSHVREEPHKSWSEAHRLVPLNEPHRPTVGPLTVDRLGALGYLPGVSARRVVDTEQVPDNGGASHPTIEDPIVSLPDHAVAAA